MVVSFVNAGLLSLMESIGVIMGANIGTTITAWLISIFGFKVKIVDFSLIIIAISFPLLFTKNSNLKNLAEVFIGFALLFMGLDALKSSVPDLKNNPEALEFLKGFSYEDKGYLGKLLTTILFVFIGTIVTIIVQSSSAAMALTLVMTSQGWIPFPLAASMVLGENIGTTITANLAALVANDAAKRSARAHFIFNVFGVVWMVLLMPFFLSGIDWYMEDQGWGSPMNSAESVPIGLSIFHSVFNILNVLILIWFARFIAKTVLKLIPEKISSQHIDLPIHLNKADEDDVEKALDSVRLELSSYISMVGEGLDHLRDYIFNAVNVAGDHKEARESILRIETKSNEWESLIAQFMTRLSKKEMDEKASTKIQKLFEINYEIENFMDLIDSMSEEIELNRKNSKKLSDRQKTRLDSLIKHISNSLKDIHSLIENDFQEGEIHKMEENESLDQIIRELKAEHTKDVLNQLEDHEISTYYVKLHNLVEQLSYRLRSLREIAESKKL